MPEFTPPSNLLATLLDTLRRTAILSDAQLSESLAKPEARGSDPRPLGRFLLQQGWLTRYQLNQLATGRDGDLVVGPYVLLDKIAEGGGGQVFRARHRVMNRIVALKRIQPEKLANPEAVQRFFQEAQVAAKLDHPHIVHAYDAGEVGGTCFLAMEFVDGMDLTRLVREGGPLSAAQACALTRQAALALQHAHERGMVHRDVKPSNLLVSPVVRTADGTRPAIGPNAILKLLDLGLARWQTGGNGGSVIAGMGTPHFVAPEQAKNADAADIRSDLYSLGCTLFYLLTGRPPFDATKPVELLQAHLSQAPPRLEAVVPTAPPALGDIIAKLLSKNPAQRHRRPSELITELDSIAMAINGRSATMSTVEFAIEPETTEANTDATSFGPTRRMMGQLTAHENRRAVLAIGIGLHLLALIIVVAVVYWRYHGGDSLQSELSTSKAKSNASTARPLVANSKSNATHTENKKSLDDAVDSKVSTKSSRRQLERGQPPNGRESLDTTLLGLAPRRVRAYPSVAPMLRRLPRSEPIEVQSLHFDPIDSSRVIGIGDRAIRLDATDGRKIDCESAFHPSQFEVNPLGTFSAAIVDNKATIVALDDCRVVSELGVEANVQLIAHSESGNYVLASYGVGMIRLWDLTKREMERELKIGESIGAVAIAPNGWLAVVATSSGRVLLCDLESATILSQESRPANVVQAITITPDGLLALTGSRDGKLVAWSLSDGQRHSSLDLQSPIQSVVAIGNDWGLAAVDSGKLVCFHLPTRKVIQFGDDSSGPLQAFALAPDRQSAFAAFKNWGLARLEFESKTE